MKRNRIKKKKKKRKKGKIFTSYDIKTLSSLLYTGGRISVAHNDSFFVSPCGKTVNFVEYESGEVIHTLKEDQFNQQEILSLSLSHDDRKLAVSLGNGDVQIYSTVNNRVLRVLHFSSPAVQLDFDPTSPLLALGFGSGQISVYHVTESKVIYSDSSHVGRVGIVRFHPKEWFLVSSSMNGFLISNVRTGQASRFRNHRGVVLGVCFVNEGKTIITTAVDKMLCVYSLSEKENNNNVFELKKKFPVFEDVVDIQTIPKEWLVQASPSLTEYRQLPDELILAGSRIGNITIWDYKNHQKAVWKYQPRRKNQQEEQDQYSNIPSFQFSYIIRSKKEVLLTTEECNFSIFSIHPKQPFLEKSRTILGFDEEILDIARISNSHFATATTGGGSDDCSVLIFNAQTKDCKALAGHTGLILALTCSPDKKFILSCGKDRTARLWHLPTMSCCGIMDSHTDAVTCVSFSRDSSFFVTGSDDRTIKMFEMKEIRNNIILLQNQQQGDEDEDDDEGEKELNILPLNFVCQFFAHSKGVTDIDISPDGNLIATSSSDKNVKIFRIIRKNQKKQSSDVSDSSSSEEEEDDELLDSEDDVRLEMFRHMKHPKGVWCVKFSRMEKVIATGGADHKIRIFSVASGTCVKLLEGHTSSVLKLDFINFGTQMVSGDSSGLLKLWIIQTNSCIKTWEAHSGGIWGMDVSRDGSSGTGRVFLTCGEDSKILCWTENSGEVLGESNREKKEVVEKIQKLENLIRNKQFGDALVLSIELDQPRRTYRILETMISNNNVQEEMDDIIKNRLGVQEVNFLFQYCVDWNTNSRYCSVAQTVLNSFFRQFNPNFLGWNYEKSLDSLLVYGEKHIKRLEKLIQGSFVLDYTLQQMNVVDENVINNEKKKKKKKKEEQSIEQKEEEEIIFLKKRKRDELSKKKKKDKGGSEEEKDEIDNFFDDDDDEGDENEPSKKKRKI